MGGGIKINLKETECETNSSGSEQGRVAGCYGPSSYSINDWIPWLSEWLLAS